MKEEVGDQEKEIEVQEKEIDEQEKEIEELKEKLAKLEKIPPLYFSEEEYKKIYTFKWMLENELERAEEKKAEMEIQPKKNTNYRKPKTYLKKTKT